jgi:WD40 repeat protein
MTQLFISHSSRNNAEALALSQWLTAEGWDDQFLDLDPQQGITAGERWEKALHQAAGRCDAVLFLISPDWLASEWCRREFTIAQQLGKRLFVLLIGAARADIPAHIKQSWQAVELAGGDDHGAAREVTLPGEAQPRFVYFSRSGLTRLREGLKKAGLDPESFPWPPADQPNRPPYCGLRPLEAEDAGIFFGREAPIIEILAQLRGLRDAAPPRFLAILGASGAGKSSFLRAGILPRLARDDRNYLTLPVIRPERAVLSGSSGLLTSLWTVRQKRGLSWSRKQLEQAIEIGASALAPPLAELAHCGSLPDWEGRDAQAPTLVLAIDQAEELFQSEGGEEAARFLALLADLLQTDSPQILVLCTIRSDSYEHLQSAPALLAVSQKTFSLPPLPKGAYRQVIEAPVAILKHSTRPLRIEAKLTDALLTDIEQGGAKDALPLLAFALERLYLHYSADGQLLLREYEDLGRIAGAIETAVDLALQAAQKNPKLPQDRDQCLKLLRRGLIPWMAGIDPRTNLPYRKVARLAQVPEEACGLIEHFVEHRLLAKDTNEQGEITVEPAHEALLRQWTKLRGWLEEDTAALATLESVKAASRDWDANAQRDAWLIHAAGRLEDAEALHQRSDLAANFDGSDRAYLAKCRKAEDERHDSELRQAHELADAQRQRAEQQKRVAQRTRVGLAVASCMLVLALIAAALALRAQDRAEIETVRAEQGLRQAAQRALSRAREQLESGNDSAYMAYLAESMGYMSPVSNEETSLAAQQQGSPALRWVVNHHDVVRVAAYSRDGRRVVTASDNGTARLWDATSGAAVGMPMHHERKVSFVAYSPDGHRLVTASADRTARLWDAKSGAALGAEMRHESWVFSAAFSPNNLRVLTASADKTARLWDASTGAALGMPMRHEDLVLSAAFSPDGLRVVTASKDGAVRIWDAVTGTVLGSPMHHNFPVLSATFSPDGLRVLTISWNTARLWDATTGRALGALMRHGGLIVTSGNFSPDGLRVLTASSEAARLWDSSSGAALGKPMRHEKSVISAAFSPDGQRVVTSSGDGTVQLWDGTTGVAMGRQMRHEKEVTSVAFSPDGSSVVTTSWDCTTRLWDATTRAALGIPMRHENAVTSAAFGPDGLRVVTASWDYSARLWDPATGVALGTPMRHENTVNSAAFSRDGMRVVTASSDSTARLWDAMSGATIGSPMRHENEVTSAVFSPDDQRVVTASEDGTAQLWSSVTGAAIGAPMRHEKEVTSAAFSPDGMLVVTTSHDKTARLWNAATGAALGSLMRHDYGVSSATFSPNGLRIVTASYDQTARLWDGTTGVALGAPMRHDSGVYSAAFSSDGLRVVTASIDQTARLWDGATGAALSAPMRHENGVKSAAFGPDGLRVVTTSGSYAVSGAARLWDAATGVAVGAPMRHENGVKSAAFSPDGLGVVTASFDGTARLWDVVNDAALGSSVEANELIALAGRHVAENGQLEYLSGLDWIALIKEVKAKADGGTTPKDKLMRWHFADRSARTISPFSQITVPQHIEREIAWVLEHPQTEKPDGPNYSPQILDDAYNLDPGHPLILLALSVFEARPETKALWKKLSFPRFEKDPRLAARAAEILLTDKDPQNARKAAEIALALPSATEEDKAKANAVLTKINAPNNGDAP